MLSISRPGPKAKRALFFMASDSVVLALRKENSLKFIYSEKATKFCKISTVDLSYVVKIKSTVEISQNFVAFSEYMNFK